MIDCVVAPVDQRYEFAADEVSVTEPPAQNVVAPEVVIDGVTGLVVPPDAASLGAAMSKAVNNPRTAQSMGDAGFESVRGITWDDAIDKLMQAASR